MYSSVLVSIFILGLFAVRDLDCLSLNTTDSSDAVTLDFNGLMPAAFTPVNDDQTLNLDLIPEYAQYLADNGFRGVSGTTGEGMALSVDERKSLYDAWIAAGKPLGLHVQVQVGGAPFTDVLTLAKYAESIGADSILTLPELYLKPNTVEELVSYVKLVANAVPDTPVLYYHYPAHSGVTRALLFEIFTSVDIEYRARKLMVEVQDYLNQLNLPNLPELSACSMVVNMPSFASAASAIPNFKGLKFSSSDVKEAAQTLNKLKGDQKIFVGSDAVLAPAALVGVDSFIGGSQSIFPQLNKDILQAVMDSDVTRARELQKKLSLALEVIGDSKTALKVAMGYVTGIEMGPPKLPNAPMDSITRKKMEHELRSMGFGFKRKHVKST